MGTLSMKLIIAACSMMNVGVELIEISKLKTQAGINRSSTGKLSTKLVKNSEYCLIPDSGGMIPISYKTKYKFDIVNGKAQCKGIANTVLSYGT